MKISFEIIEDIHQTNFYDVFCRSDAVLPQKIFALDDWNVIALSLKDYLFNEGNAIITESLHDLFLKEENFVYITPCVLQHETPNYSTVKFSSYLGLTGLRSELPDPHDSNMSTNWSNDFIWGGNGNWGIYHLHDAWLIVLGYSPRIEDTVTRGFGMHPMKTKNSDVLEALTYYISDVNTKIDFITKSRLNNPWLG